MTVVDLLRLLPPLVVLALAVVLVMGETGVVVGLLFPVEITLMTVGFLAYVGDLPLAPVFLLMIAAAIAGDALALRSGRKHGPRVRASRLGRWVGEQRWGRADRILHRLGGRSAFVARWVPFVRTLLPRLAGSAGMRYRTFAPWNYAGVLTAVGSSVIVGYLAGASYQRVAAALGRATTAVLLLLLLVVALILVGRWLGRHPHPVLALVRRAAALPPLRWLSQWYGAAGRQRGAAPGRLAGGPDQELPLGRLSARARPRWVIGTGLATGLALLFGLGLAVTWLVQLVVARSGLSAADDAVAGWFNGHRTAAVAGVAEGIAAVLRGSVLIAVVTVAAVVLGFRSRPWRTDLVGVVGTAGAFVPLVVLAIAAELTGGGDDAPAATRVGGSTVAVAGLCLLAWLLTRHAGWPRIVAGGTAAAVGIVLVVAARLYLGWDAASEAVTATLLGVLWPVVFMIAWSTRDRAVTRPEPVAIR